MDGLRDFDLKFVMRDLAVPVVTTFGLALAAPYVLAHMVFPIFLADFLLLLYFSYIDNYNLFSVLLSNLTRGQLSPGPHFPARGPTQNIWPFLVHFVNGQQLI